MVDDKFEFRHVFKFSKLLILQPENISWTSNFSQPVSIDFSIVLVQRTCLDITKIIYRDLEFLVTCLQADLDWFIPYKERLYI